MSERTGKTRTWYRGCGHIRVFNAEQKIVVEAHEGDAKLAAAVVVVVVVPLELG